VHIDASGDVDSIFDKSIHRELLSSPIRLAISTDAPQQFPAWNMDFDQEQAAPRSYVSGPATIRIVENGPVRVALQVSRETEGSHFVQTIRLSAGAAGDRVEFQNAIDWRTKAANLKAVFPLTATNKSATYNWEVGTVQRPTAKPNQFEVGSHYWIDQTDHSGAWGTMILTNTKNGSDKRDDQTIRLTLLRTPGFPASVTPEQAAHRAYSDQLSQDWGHHEILYGLTGHKGDWSHDQTDWQAYRLSTPLLAFTTAHHPGPLGRSFSLVHIDNPSIRILALKKAETSGDIILRLVELHGKEAPGVHVNFAVPIQSATETDGQERPERAASAKGGALDVSFTPYQPRTFALHLGDPPARVRAVTSEPVTLSYDRAVASQDDTHSNGGFDAKGDAMPAEMLPAVLHFDGTTFHLAPGGANNLNAVTAKGQTISLPEGDFNRLYILAASANGDREAIFRTGAISSTLDIEDWTGFIGQWDTRLWKAAPDMVMVGKPGRREPLRTDWAVSANHAKWNLEDHGSLTWSPRYPDDYLGLAPGYIKRAPLAWYASHYHTPDGLNQPYAYSYLFGYSIGLPPHTKTLTLPDDPAIRILAITIARTRPAVLPAHPLYDTLNYKSANAQ
jgi:alpha-mannosidase